MLANTFTIQRLIVLARWILACLVLNLVAIGWGINELRDYGRRMNGLKTGLQMSETATRLMVNEFQLKANTRPTVIIENHGKVEIGKKK